MGRIVAISGGELETTEKLNQYMVRLSGKKNANVLFIGTASKDAEGYIKGIEEAFGKLGCKVDNLSLVKKKYTEIEIDHMLNWADVIYVGGGDTVFMMDVWKQYAIDRKLLAIYKEDKAVLGGLSAGAICWFECGHSDSEAFSGKEDWQYVIAEGMLGIHHLAFCPHYNEEGRDSFDIMLKEKDLEGLAMDNNTAFVEADGKISFIRSREDANAYRIRYQDGIMKKESVVFE